jgi:hypothetical protein
MTNTITNVTAATIVWKTDSNRVGKSKRAEKRARGAAGPAIASSPARRRGQPSGSDWMCAAVTRSEGGSVDLAGKLASGLRSFIPWTAVNLVDYFIVRHGRYAIEGIFNPNRMYGRCSRPGHTV